MRIPGSMFICVGTICALLPGCGGAAPNEGTTPKETSDAPMSQSVPAEVEGTKPTPDVPAAEITEVHRKPLNELLAKGPAYLLSLVQFDSVVNNERFVGFRIVSFRTDHTAVLGLKPNDVIMKVNGRSIERPEQFQAIFDGLKEADKIAFSVIRDGAPINLETPILP